MEMEYYKNRERIKENKTFIHPNVYPNNNTF